MTNSSNGRQADPAADNPTHQAAAPAFVLRPMTTDDIPTVVAIDRLSFPNPWAYTIYLYEVARNPSSEMVALALVEPGAPVETTRGWLRRWWDRLRGITPPYTGPTVIGYGGFWRAQQRAHISTIAVHPAWRGHSLGELLLASMVWRAIAFAMERVTLEVRVSNHAAITLYEKYGFQRSGIKPGYYNDNKEDAYDMRIPALDAAYRAGLADRWRALADRITFADTFTGGPVPAAKPSAGRQGSPHR